MNKCVYIWTLIISIALIVLEGLVTNSFSGIGIGVGCSGIAASIMAIFLDSTSNKRENESKNNARKLYFGELHEQLKMMLERIIWFDMRMDESGFDWNKDPATYSSLNYMIWASTIYHEEKIANSDIESKIKEIAKKYDADALNSMTPSRVNQVKKMFTIIAVSGLNLVNEMNSIEKNKLLLDAE